MSVTGNQVTALLATIVPLVASIFAQQSERQERSRARAAEERTRLEAKWNADNVVDSTSATELHDTLKTLVNQPSGKSSNGEFCSTLHTSLELLRQSDPTPKTEAVLAAWLTYRPEKVDGRLVCQCKRTIGVAHEAWDKLGGSGPASRPVPKELLFALNAANEECNSTFEPSVVPATGNDLPRLDLESPDSGARVYIQVPDKTAREALLPVQRALRSVGYRVHEIEIVGKRAPRCAELRYVYPRDTGEATTLLGDLNTDPVLGLIYGTDPSASRPRFTAKRMSRYEGRSLNRVYELWLPAERGQRCST